MEKKWLGGPERQRLLKKKTGAVAKNRVTESTSKRQVIKKG